MRLAVTELGHLQVPEDPHCGQKSLTRFPRGSDVK